MAYPTNSLSIVLQDVDRQLVRLKQQCSQWISTLNGNADALFIINMVFRLRAEKEALQAAAATPGIGVYAQNQKSDGTLDVAAEFNAIVLAITAASDWIVTNIPKDSNGYLLVQQFIDGTLTDRQFTSTQTAVLRSHIQNIFDLIN